MYYYESLIKRLKNRTKNVLKKKIIKNCIEKTKFSKKKNKPK